MTISLNSARSTRLASLTLLLLLSFGATSPRSIATPVPSASPTVEQGVTSPEDSCKTMMKDLNKAIQANPKDSETLTIRAECFVTLGNHQAAIVDLTEALKFDQTVQYGLRGKSYMALKDYKNALADFDADINQRNTDAARITDPQVRQAALPNVWNYVDRGQAHQALGNSKAAIVDFDKALTFDHKGTYYSRGYVYNQRAFAKLSLGQKQAALQDLQQAAKEYGSGEEYDQIMKSIKELQ